MTLPRKPEYLENLEQSVKDVIDIEGYIKEAMPVTASEAQIILEKLAEIKKSMLAVIDTWYRKPAKGKSRRKKRDVRR